MIKPCWEFEIFRKATPRNGLCITSEKYGVFKNAQEGKKRAPRYTTECKCGGEGG